MSATKAATWQGVVLGAVSSTRGQLSAALRDGPAGQASPRARPGLGSNPSHCCLQPRYQAAAAVAARPGSQSHLRACFSGGVRPPEQAEQRRLVGAVLPVQPGGINRLRRLISILWGLDRKVTPVKAVDEEEAQAVQHGHGLQGSVGKSPTLAAEAAAEQRRDDSGRVQERPDNIVAADPTECIKCRVRSSGGQTGLAAAAVAAAAAVHLAALGGKRC